MKRVHRYLLTILLSFSLVLPALVFAQEDEDSLTLRINRDFGFGAGSKIQGRFSMRASGPDDLVRVEFIIDGVVVNEDVEAPFRHNFSTDEYSPGAHKLSALGYVRGGAVLSSVTFTYEFLTAEDARSGTLKLVVPILVIVGGLSLVALIVPALLGKRKGAFKIGEYGAAGGAVCPRCTFPYSRHMFAPNLVLGKLARCPHCGKWAVVGRASPADLEAAEVRLQEDHELGRRPIDREEDEDMKRLLEESRFEE
jgi:hypothetical protein